MQDEITKGGLVALWVNGQRIECSPETVFEAVSESPTPLKPAFSPWIMAEKATSGVWEIPMVVREVPTPTSVKEAEERLPPSI